MQLLQWKSSEYYPARVCVWSLRYPAFNVHAPCCYPWPAPIYNIFPHYLIHDTFFGGKKGNRTKMCVLISLQFRLKHFSSWEEMSEMWSTIYIDLHVNNSYSFSDFNETWIFSTEFRKIVKYQISWKSIQWQPSGQTDRHDKANSRFSQATDDCIIRRLRIACWIHKTTNTHSEYAVLIAFPLQQWLR
jgi:hypothetical protein